MKKTFVILFIIGVLVSTGLLSQSSDSDTITLTDSNHITFNGPVNDASVSKAQLELGRISRRLPNSATIYIVIDSPGGSVSAGNLFIDFARSLPQKIKPICIFCASMGYHMFQSFDERLVYSSSTLMSHRVAIGGLSGQVPGEAVTRLNNIIAVSNKMDEFVAKRIGMSVKDYQNLIYNELWIDGQTAVKTKHADRVAKIKCSSSILGETKQETVNTLFGAVTLTLSKCPLISGALDVKYGGAFRSRAEAVEMVRRAKRSVMWNF